MPTKKSKPVSSNEITLDVESGLNHRQEQFCRLYMNGWKEVDEAGKVTDQVRMGNGVRAYAKVYGYEIDSDPGAFAVCVANASRLLTNAKVINFLNELKRANGWTHQAIDNRLMEIAFTGNRADSIAAIREMNKIDRRITDVLEVEHKGFILDIKEVDADSGAAGVDLDQAADGGLAIPA